MKAAVGTPNGLEIREVPQLRPKPTEVLVKIRAAGLNRADLGAARGSASHGTPGTPIGLAWAGEVVETGAEVKGYKPGDKVIGSGSGGYAEYAVSDWGRTASITDGIGFLEAATLPMALLTMHDALMTNGRLKAGESV